MAQFTTLQVVNKNNYTLSAGKVVYISGYDESSQNTTADLADYSNSTKLPAIGVIQDDIIPGDIGLVILQGVCAGYNTIAAKVNSPVYVGSSGNIIFDNPVNLFGHTSQQIGIVLRSNNPNGIILVQQYNTTIIQESLLPV